MEQTEQKHLMVWEKMRWKLQRLPAKAKLLSVPWKECHEKCIKGFHDEPNSAAIIINFVRHQIVKIKC
jgi:hypothetical protein